MEHPRNCGCRDCTRDRSEGGFRLLVLIFLFGPLVPLVMFFRWLWRLLSPPPPKARTSDDTWDEWVREARDKRARR
jgi:cytochrome b561